MRHNFYLIYIQKVKREGGDLAWCYICGNGGEDGAVVQMDERLLWLYWIIFRSGEIVPVLWRIG